MNSSIPFSCCKELYFVDLPSKKMKDFIFVKDAADWRGLPSVILPQKINFYSLTKENLVILILEEIQNSKI